MRWLSFDRIGGAGHDDRDSRGNALDRLHRDYVVHDHQPGPLVLCCTGNSTTWRVKAALLMCHVAEVRSVCDL